MMHLTGPPSSHFDPALVEAPERRGGVAWSLFNQHYHRLQTQPWSRINQGGDFHWPWPRRVTRLLMAWFIQRTGAILDLRKKAALLAGFPLPRDPDVIFFGAEAGWEAALVRALFGDRGRVVLVDCDPAAYRRFLDAPAELTVPGRRPLVLRKDAVEYVRQDFFDYQAPAAFDVGLDWGLLEHFPGGRKADVLRRFATFLRPGGVQISAVPRDSLSSRAFYRAFGEELNFGYRELLDPHELEAALESGGFEVLARAQTATTCVALGRPRR